MKHLKLKNSSFELLEKGFGEWLGILGYCKMSTYNMPNIIREFLYFLETNNINQITALQQNHYKNYFAHISTRTNQRRGGGLSNNSLNKHLQALEKFYEFLIHKGVQNLPPITLRQLQLDKGTVTVLTQEEIQAFYEAANQESATLKEATLQARDRVLLTVFYGCGLRRNEGANLTLEDINFDTRIIHVRKGKNYRERLVPFSKQSLIYLQEWVYDYRPRFVKNSQNNALFIGRIGNAMTANSLYARFKLLQQQVENTALQTKEIGLHTLRHSIATHLLQNGMELQKIQRFLGHSSLESTQIYTHLIEKDEPNI